MRKPENLSTRRAIVLGTSAAVLIVCTLYARAAVTPNRGVATSGVQPSTALAGGDDCPAATIISSLPYADSGDTNNATNSLLILGSACSGGGAGSREGPDLIYSFTVGSGNSVTFTVTPETAWDPAIYILGTCGSGSSCVAASDAGFEGQPDTIGPITLPIGTYFFYVDSVYPADDNFGAGDYTLNVTGTLGNLGANSSFYTLDPCRILDTRDPNGPFGGPAITGTPRTFAVAGRCGIPADARSLSVNVTVTQPAAQGHLIVFPGGTSVPGVSTLNFRAGQTRANNAIVPLGSGATISAVSSTTTHFILDVNGYFK